MPRVPPFDFSPWRGNVWRVIEGQYRPSTARIVDTNAEQTVLEQALEETKPPVPEPCRHLDWQFRSPFRYGCYPKDSRFRRRGRTPGVFYGSEHSLTALIESVWGRIRFFRASPATPWPRSALEHTAICADIQAERTLDLTAEPMASSGNWSAPEDYTDCLALAEAARGEGCDAIRYQSVRDPARRANLAVLQCSAFGQPAPIRLETWKVLMTPERVRAYCETLRQNHEFRIGAVALETSLPAG